MLLHGAQLPLLQGTSVHAAVAQSVLEQLPIRVVGPRPVELHPQPLVFRVDASRELGPRRNSTVGVGRLGRAAVAVPLAGDGGHLHRVLRVGLEPRHIALLRVLVRHVVAQRVVDQVPVPVHLLHVDLVAPDQAVAVPVRGGLPRDRQGRAVQCSHLHQAWLSGNILVGADQHLRGRGAVSDGRSRKHPDPVLGPLVQPRDGV
uniref:Uncharacterized protein n=1 Tax=Ixodes ricinus TaxID=34613 RepID=A0A6B0V3X0_IXORI